MRAVKLLRFSQEKEKIHSYIRNDTSFSQEKDG